MKGIAHYPEQFIKGVINGCHWFQDFTIDESKNHIPIISFLKPGLIKVLKDNSEDEFYVEDGILEFKDNTLSILTSSIFNLKDKNKDIINKNLEEAEKQLQNNNLDDQNKFLLSQKIDVLKLIN